MILNKENTFTEQNRFLVYSDQLNATRKQILDTAEEMISRSAIQTFEDEGESVTATDASYLASLTVDGKAVQDGTPTPSSPVPVEVVEPVGGVFGISINGAVTPIDLQGNILASLPDGTKDVLTVDSVGHCVLEKRVDVVDLGSLTWSRGERPASSGTYRFGSSAFASGLSGTIDNILCSLYQANASYGPTGPNSVDGAMCMYGNNVYIRNDSYTTAESFKTAMSGILLYYPFATPQTIDLGYIDMPTMSDGAVVSITAEVTPTIAVKWWTKNQSDVAVAFSALSSDLAALQGAVSALDVRVTALESANAKPLVLEKLETSKEVASDDAEDEQEEMNFDDAE